MSEIGFDAAAFAGEVSAETSKIYERSFKRLCDIALVVCTAPISLPLIAVLMLITRISGPALFGHTRIGQNGKEFRCWKIRTMIPNAEDDLMHLLTTNPIAAYEWARDRKLQQDPRVTRFGKFLRRSSLDELPQLWNVLMGEMSLVGPRPVTENELENYSADKWAYLGRLPGITGLWQVSGRNSVSYDERVALDVAYSRRLSFLTDCSILLRTGSAVLRRTGL